MEAQPHPLQAERLSVLYSYEILDTDREKEFDDVAQLAAGICETPIAVVNLIDGERQWFKAEVGLGVRETPLATSICSHVILQDEFVQITDTLTDPRMADNPLCCGAPGLRFYAGALLTSDDGLPIGTLCVLDYQPRSLSPFQRDALKVLARQVMAQLDLKRALKAAELLRKEVDHRVKNSLMSLSALAGIQARMTNSEEAQAALEMMRQRIRTVSMLHEMLYKTDSGTRVDLGHYVRNLCDFLRQIAPDNVGVEVEADPLPVTSEMATSAGTLINEFAANSFKHGFPDGRAGTVRISLKRGADGTAVLSCADDGVGMAVGGLFDGAGLGMKIADAAAQQLGGTLKVATEGGVSIEVAFDAGRE